MAPSNFISVMKRPFWNSQSMNGGQYRNVEWISNYFPGSQRRLNIREERGEKSNSVTPTWIWRRQIQFGNQLHSLTCKNSHDLQLRPKEGKSILYDLSWTQSQCMAILHHFVLRKTGIYIYILFISSVRSSNSHPDLLLIHHHHPLFQITPVLNTGLSLSEPLQLYKGYNAI